MRTVRPSPSHGPYLRPRLPARHHVTAAAAAAETPSLRPLAQQPARRPSPGVQSWLPLRALGHAPPALQRQCALRTVVFKNVEVAADSSNAVVKTDSMVNTAFWLCSKDSNSPDDVSMAASRDVVAEGKEKGCDASTRLENEATNLRAGVLALVAVAEMEVLEEEVVVEEEVEEEVVVVDVICNSRSLDPVQSENWVTAHSGRAC
jgi:hypothetical protein